MTWRYYRKGKMVKECNDIPATVEDAVIELEENGVDVSDCLVKPLTPEEEKEYFKAVKALKYTKAPKGFETRLNRQIKALKPSFYKRFKLWCGKWTDEEVSYLLFWLIASYIMIGIVKYEPKMLEIILWPFM